MEGYLGEVKYFGGTYPPKCWTFCEGQLLPVSEYAALFSVISNQFGGDGINNFKLPDLRGRMALGSGQGQGLSYRAPGDYGGYETVSVTEYNMPAHNHSVKCDITSQDRDLSNTPQDNLPAKPKDVNGYGKNETGNPCMKSDMVSQTGGGQAHQNMSPYCCTNHIICIEGIYPPRS